ncbi:hypothetical protein [Streptomyces sp. SPB162]|uniref:hypothetical protein n=1 Tax=Streptomyces sp. SPB162 TaxID=2940560 RepID=UPI00240630D3|nr:hypothetical protein [Streptomyces sp. SPB162]MDF9811206.1 hypothetical protein [Streptomyces sp. SPB162]
MAIWVMSYVVRKVFGAAMVKKATRMTRTPNVQASLTAATRLAHPGRVIRVRAGEASGAGTGSAAAFSSRGPSGSVMSRPATS